MTDKTDEEHLDNPTNIQSENPSGKIIPTKNIDIVNPNQEIENMEVHHHPDVHHKKKNFKEYFLEFLMIFLAVTMGFFAENIRENISENKIERNMAYNLYQEVHADSIAVRQKIAFREKKIEQMSYFIAYVKDSSLAPPSRNFMPSFYWSFILNSGGYFQPKDGTINQLINSGELRYFKNRELQAHIAALTVAIAGVRSRNDLEISFTDFQGREFLMKYFDFDWLETISQHDRLSTPQVINLFRDSLLTVPSKLRNEELFNRKDAEGIAGIYLLIIRATAAAQYSDYSQANHELLEGLRNEYNLKDN
jgi:hypothetical protein